MKKIILLVILAFLSLPSVKGGDTSAILHGYWTFNKRTIKQFPLKIRYCEYLFYNSCIGKIFKVKKMNRILNRFDSIGFLNIIYFASFNSYHQIPKIKKISGLSIHYREKFNDTDLFYEKNIKRLEIFLSCDDIIKFPRPNYNLSYLYTSNRFDSTILNLKNVDTIGWQYEIFDSACLKWIIKKELFCLQLYPEVMNATLNDIDTIISVIESSPSIRCIHVNYYQFENGARERIDDYCRVHDIELVIPKQFNINSPLF